MAESSTSQRVAPNNVIQRPKVTKVFPSEKLSELMGTSGNHMKQRRRSVVFLKHTRHVYNILFLLSLIGPPFLA